MPYGLIPLLTGLLNLFLAVFVLSRDSSRETNRSFCYWMIAAALWNFMDFGMDVIPREDFALAWATFLAGSIAFIPSTFFHFVLAFIYDQNPLNKKLSRLAYGVSLILLPVCLLGYEVKEIREIPGYGGFHYPIGRPPTYQLLMIFFYFFVLYGAYLLFRRFRKSQSSLVRNSLKYLLIGLGIAIMGGVTNFLLASGTIRVFPLGHIANAIMCITFAYAIVRYHLMDINVIIRRGIVYSLLTGVLSGVFFLALVMFERLFYITTGFQRTIYSSITTAFVISIVFQPLRERLQHFVDRSFFKEGYERKLALLNLSQRITTSLDRQELLSSTLGTLSQVFPIDRGIILLYREVDQGFKVSLSIGLSHLNRQVTFFQEDSGLIKYLKRAEYALLRAEAEENPEIDSRLLKDFDTLGVELCVPIIYGGELLGILALGGKTSNRLYSPEEIEILMGIGEKIALGVKNTKLHEEMKENFFGTVISLIKAIEARNAYTWEHCANVAEYAAEVAEELGLSQEMIKDIKTGGLLHDIGKIGIDDEVLLKPGRLNEEEFTAVKRHPSIGSMILKPIDLAPSTREGIDQHHERLDGSGYPNGFKEKEISMAARILAVVDVYDAMTTDRPYRKALNREEAIEELMKGAGRTFDGDVVKTFLKVLKRKE